MWLSSQACLDWTHHWASGHWTTDSGRGCPVPFWRSHIPCEVVWFPVPHSHWYGSHPAGRPPARSPQPHIHSHWRRWGVKLWPHPWGWPSCDSLQRREDSSVTPGEGACRAEAHEHPQAALHLYNALWSKPTLAHINLTAAWVKKHSQVERPASCSEWQSHEICVIKIPTTFSIWMLSPDCSWSQLSLVTLTLWDWQNIQ